MDYNLTVNSFIAYMRLDSGWPDSSRLFSPGHPRSILPNSAVAQRSVASQHFTSFGSMQGGSLRGNGEKGARRAHTCIIFEMQ